MCRVTQWPITPKNVSINCKLNSVSGNGILRWNCWIIQQIFILTMSPAHSEIYFYVFLRKQKEARCGGTCLQFQHWGGWGKKIKSSRSAWAKYIDPYLKKLRRGGVKEGGKEEVVKEEEKIQKKLNFSCQNIYLKCEIPLKIKRPASN